MEQFQRLEQLGRGSYGRADLCQDIDTGERLVIKSVNLFGMKEAESALAKQEVVLLSSMQHPSIVGYRGAFIQDGELHILMEYCEARDLAAKIRGAKERSPRVPFPENQILDWLAQLASAVAYIHRRRVLHRDIKPGNVFLTRDDRVRLGDFGIARVLDHAAEQARTFVGTPYSMAPEMCTGDGYSYSSDIWGLGCVIYELATLERPFNEATLALLFKMVQFDPYKPLPSHYSPEFRELLDSLLAKRPESRPAAQDILRLPLIAGRLPALGLALVEGVGSSVAIPRPVPAPAPAPAPALSVGSSSTGNAKPAPQQPAPEGALSPHSSSSSAHIKAAPRQQEAHGAVVVASDHRGRRKGSDALGGSGATPSLLQPHTAGPGGTGGILSSIANHNYPLPSPAATPGRIHLGTMGAASAATATALAGSASRPGSASVPQSAHSSPQLGAFPSSSALPPSLSLVPPSGSGASTPSALRSLGSGGSGGTHLLTSALSPGGGLMVHRSLATPTSGASSASSGSGALAALRAAAGMPLPGGSSRGTGAQSAPSPAPAPSTLSSGSMVYSTTATASSAAGPVTAAPLAPPSTPRVPKLVKEPSYFGIDSAASESSPSDSGSAAGGSARSTGSAGHYSPAATGSSPASASASPRRESPIAVVGRNGPVVHGPGGTGGGSNRPYRDFHTAISGGGGGGGGVGVGPTSTPTRTSGASPVDGINLALPVDALQSRGSLGGAVSAPLSPRSPSGRGRGSRHASPSHIRLTAGVGSGPLVQSNRHSLSPAHGNSGPISARSRGETSPAHSGFEVAAPSSQQQQQAAGAFASGRSSPALSTVARSRAASGVIGLGSDGASPVHPGSGSATPRNGVSPSPSAKQRLVLISSGAPVSLGSTAHEPHFGHSDAHSSPSRGVTVMLDDELPTQVAGSAGLQQQQQQGQRLGSRLAPLLSAGSSGSSTATPQGLTPRSRAASPLTTIPPIPAGGVTVVFPALSTLSSGDSSSPAQQHQQQQQQQYARSPLAVPSSPVTGSVRVSDLHGIPSLHGSAPASPLLRHLAQQQQQQSQQQQQPSAALRKTSGAFLPADSGAVSVLRIAPGSPQMHALPGPSDGLHPPVSVRRSLAGAGPSALLLDTGAASLGLQSPVFSMRRPSGSGGIAPVSLARGLTTPGGPAPSPHHAHLLLPAAASAPTPGGAATASPSASSGGGIGSAIPWEARRKVSDPHSAAAALVQRAAQVRPVSGSAIGGGGGGGASSSVAGGRASFALDSEPRSRTEPDPGASVIFGMSPAPSGRPSVSDSQRASMSDQPRRLSSLEVAAGLVPAVTPGGAYPSFGTTGAAGGGALPTTARSAFTFFSSPSTGHAGAFSLSGSDRSDSGQVQQQQQVAAGTPTVARQQQSLLHASLARMGLSSGAGSSVPGTPLAGTARTTLPATGQLSKQLSPLPTHQLHQPRVGLPSASTTTSTAGSLSTQVGAASGSAGEGPASTATAAGGRRSVSGASGGGGAPQHPAGILGSPGWLVPPPSQQQQQQQQQHLYYGPADGGASLSRAISAVSAASSGGSSVDERYAPSLVPQSSGAYTVGAGAAPTTPRDRIGSRSEFTTPSSSPPQSPWQQHRQSSSPQHHQMAQISLPRGQDGAGARQPSSASAPGSQVLSPFTGVRAQSAVTATSGGGPARAPGGSGIMPSAGPLQQQQAGSFRLRTSATPTAVSSLVSPLAGNGSGTSNAGGSATGTPTPNSAPTPSSSSGAAGIAMGGALHRTSAALAEQRAAGGGAGQVFPTLAPSSRTPSRAHSPALSSSASPHLGPTSHGSLVGSPPPHLLSMGKAARGQSTASASSMGEYSWEQGDGPRGTGSATPGGKGLPSASPHMSSLASAFSPNAVPTAFHPSLAPLTSPHPHAGFTGANADSNARRAATQQPQHQARQQLVPPQPGAGPGDGGPFSLLSPSSASTVGSLRSHEGSSASGTLGGGGGGDGSTHQHLHMGRSLMSLSPDTPMPLPPPQQHAGGTSQRHGPAGAGLTSLSLLDEPYLVASALGGGGGRLVSIGTGAGPSGAQQQLQQPTPVTGGRRVSSASRGSGPTGPASPLLSSMMMLSPPQLQLQPLAPLPSPLHAAGTGASGPGSRRFSRDSQTSLGGGHVYHLPSPGVAGAGSGGRGSGQGGLGSPQSPPGRSSSMFEASGAGGSAFDEALDGLDDDGDDDDDVVDGSGSDALGGGSDVEEAMTSIRRHGDRASTSLGGSADSSPALVAHAAPGDRIALAAASGSRATSERARAQARRPDPGDTNEGGDEEHEISEVVSQIMGRTA